MPDIPSFTLMITDLSTRKAFDLANIMRSKGIKLLLCDDVGGTRRQLLQIVYKGKIERLRKGKYFLSDLGSILQRYKDYKLVYIPIEEDTTLQVYDFLSKNRAENFYHNLPPKEAFDTVRDKGRFAAFCERHEIPIPKTFTCEALREQKTLPAPLIFKPISGSGSAGIRFVDTKEALIEACKSLPMERYLIQERLENPQAVEGGFFLFDAGKPVAYYGHKRIRTYPETGGVSVYSKCALQPQLQKLGEAVLEKLGWSGLAMIEFLYDPKSKAYKVIEINPRLWGSLMLSEFCGSEMLLNYCLSALKLPMHQADIQEDRYLRWFFPWDVLGYIRKRGRIEGFWRRNAANTCYINFSYTDYFAALLFMFYNLLDPAKWMKFRQKVLGR